LAPEIPEAGNTAVDILLDGVFSGITLTFGQATGFVPLPAGSYEVGIAPAGSTTPVLTLPLVLAQGDIVTAVAIRDTEIMVTDSPIAVLAFPGSTDDLPDGEGRVFVGHGADDTLLNPVGVIDATNCPPPIINEFAFATVAGPLDLPEVTIPVAFSLRPSDDECAVSAGPLDAPVTPGVVTILVAVDNDVSNESLAPAIYALIGDAEGTIPTLMPAP
jgi:hypothetical protein